MAVKIKRGALRIKDLDVLTNTELLGMLLHELKAKKLILSQWRGKYYVRRYVKPKNPKTKKQQKHRDKLKRAVEEWHKLDDADKKRYDTLAKGKPMTGFNLFVSEYMREN